MFEDTELSEEEMANFCHVLGVLVKKSGGMFEGRLFATAIETGERVEIHLQAHDSVLCEMHRLEELGKSVGGETLQ